MYIIVFVALVFLVVIIVIYRPSIGGQLQSQPQTQTIRSLPVPPVIDSTPPVIYHTGPRWGWGHGWGPMWGPRWRRW